MTSNTEKIPVQGKKPSIKSLELQKAGIKLFAETPESLNNAAKTLVALAIPILTAYAGLFAFFEINEKIDSPYIFSCIMVVWLLSIIFGILAFMPFGGQIDINCITDIETALYKISNRKQRFLYLGFAFFIIFLLLSTCLLWFGTS